MQFATAAQAQAALALDGERRLRAAQSPLFALLFGGAAAHSMCGLRCILFTGLAV